MKIDVNSQAVQYAQAGYMAPDGRVGVAAPEYETAGASFEKNTQNVFVEQVQKAVEKEAGQDAAAGAKSRAEILSNLVTERDLAQFKEFGDDLEEEELDVIVTVVEKIKAQLMTHCDDYEAGMAQELSAEQLEKISATTSGAVYIAKKLAQHNVPVTEENITDTLNALDMADNTGELTEDAKVYCLRRDLELTIENVYMAQHSGAYEGGASYFGDGSGYYAKAAQVQEAENLRPQIERRLMQDGFPADEKTIMQAQWLVEKQLPLTKENLLKLQNLEQLEENEKRADSSEVILEYAIEAILDGKRPAQAIVGEAASVAQRSTHAVAVVEQASGEQMAQVVASGQELTITALEQAGAGQSESAGDAESQPGIGENQAGFDGQAADSAKNTEAAQAEDTVSTDEQEIQFITARRQLEEVRMRMTVEAAAIMIRNGISVETESMQNLINHLQHIEDQYYGRLLSKSRIEPTDANISLYKEVTNAVDQIGRSPAALIGTVAFAQTKQTVQTICEEGLVWNERYRQAEEAYEQVMTKPRSDMGDSIQKAFRNVDAILEEMGLEPTQANERAVRILGYNSMEITAESVARVKEADQKLNTMLEGMKPQTVLKMIREGYNPLDKTVEEVNKEVSALRAQTQAEQENYSEFLWRLEQAQEISKEERSAYIGIYRMMHQIEKTDGAVVGALLEQGMPLTMRNMMTGIRSAKHKAMDYKVGEMDGVDGTKINGITEQIEESYTLIHSAKRMHYGVPHGYAYFGQLAGAVNKQMTGVDFGRMPLDKVMDLSMEQFADYVQNLPKGGNENDYTKEQMQTFAQAAQVDENVLSLLAENGDIPITLGNMLAAEQMFSGESTLFRQLKDYADGTDETPEEEIMRHFTQIEEQFTDEASAGQAWQTFADYAENLVNQAAEEETITYAQMKNWKLLSSQIRLAQTLSSQSDYHIPVEIGGELTNVHVQLLQSEEKQEKVAISVNTPAFGKASVLFAVRHTKTDAVLEGYVQTDSQNAMEQVRQAEPALRESVQASSGLVVGNIGYSRQESLDLAKISADFSREQTKGVSTASLYQTAKAVIGILKEYL